MADSRRTELHKLMKDAKMYTLPTSCPCGYVAKKNWIEMEVHYDKCSQFRNVIKKESIDKIKSGLEAIKLLDKLVPMIREAEAVKKGMGYEILRKHKDEIPKDIYLFVEACLNNPDKDYKININYKKPK